MDTPLPALRSAENAASTRIVSGTLEALMFRDILKPLAAALGPAGDVVLDRVVDAAFVRPQR